MTHTIYEGKHSFIRKSMQLEYVALECYKTGLKASVIKDLPEYLRFRDQYIIVDNEKGAAGYVRWFPVKESLVKKILREGTGIGAVTRDELAEFRIGEKTDVLIHSAALLPMDVSEEVLGAMASVLRDKLRSYHYSGRFIGNIVAIVSTDTEREICSLLGLEKISGTEDAEIYYAPGKNIL